MHVTSANRLAERDQYRLCESIRVARFAAEVAVHSGQATTAASRVSHAVADLVAQRLALQHGLER